MYTFGHELQYTKKKHLNSILLLTNIFSSSNFAESIENNKRNIGALKNSPVHGHKVKRDVGYDDFPDESEILAPVYQMAPLNYDELRYVMSELYPNYGSDNIQNEKRFLGKANFTFINC